MRFASRSAIIVSCLVLFVASTSAADPPADMTLFKLINEYRKENGLEAVPLAPELTKVAHTHLQDLIKNKPHEKSKNLNAWSDKGNWTPGIPGSAGKDSWTIMWHKPKEIAGWEGLGFELNRFAGSNETVKDVLGYWKKEQATKDVLLNTGRYKKPWKAMGTASGRGFYIAWFAW